MRPSRGHHWIYGTDCCCCMQDAHSSFFSLNLLCIFLRALVYRSLSLKIGQDLPVILHYRPICGHNKTTRRHKKENIHLLFIDLKRILDYATVLFVFYCFSRAPKNLFRLSPPDIDSYFFIEFFSNGRYKKVPF